MDIKILGSGCAKCQTLERITHEAVDELGLSADFEKVTDPGEIAAMGSHVHARPRDRRRSRALRPGPHQRRHQAAPGSLTLRRLASPTLRDAPYTAVRRVLASRDRMGWCSFRSRSLK